MWRAQIVAVLGLLTSARAAEACLPPPPSPGIETFADEIREARSVFAGRVAARVEHRPTRALRDEATGEPYVVSWHGPVRHVVETERWWRGVGVAQALVEDEGCGVGFEEGAVYVFLMRDDLPGNVPMHAIRIGPGVYPDSVLRLLGPGRPPGTKFPTSPLPALLVLGVLGAGVWAGRRFMRETSGSG